MISLWRLRRKKLLIMDDSDNEIHFFQKNLAQMAFLSKCAESAVQQPISPLINTFSKQHNSETRNFKKILHKHCAKKTNDKTDVQLTTDVPDSGWRYRWAPVPACIKDADSNIPQTVAVDHGQRQHKQCLCVIILVPDKCPGTPDLHSNTAAGWGLRIRSLVDWRHTYICA